MNEIETVGGGVVTSIQVTNTNLQAAEISIDETDVGGIRGSGLQRVNVGAASIRRNEMYWVFRDQRPLLFCVPNGVYIEITTEGGEVRMFDFTRGIR